ncbi:uncharacterized protein LDX57_012498 [Aspergillus melleus]|uniref:uncharacterized protein n=1 Tax=Aspergillus melleus TaxID=138277 RepID=UPI001E8D3C0E|nr:uncharacterized protein LDX57_012498 [Aspergillus melleus]KAH8434867.1 hypothetical protein LDX57_012498 [Aspergillus melleus]
MLRKEGATGNEVDWVPVSANSSLAFDTLLSFCSTEGLQSECLVGFASVLLLTSVAGFLPPPKSAPPVSIPDTPIRSSERQGQDMIIEDLFQSIDKCMFFSSTWDAAESLLCSAFFDPSVPCNLLGASTLGIRKAISTANTIDDQQLLNAITYMGPDLGLLWNAAICNDQANALLNMAFKGLPPICLVAAFLTNTNHTFLQIDYHSTNLGVFQVARANEFQTSLFCRSDISVPWSPAPPFGATTVQNLSLKVRAHLAHQHKPLSWRLYWMLDSGERIAANESHQLVLQESNMCGPCPAGQTDKPPDPERNLADEQSGEATSRLFNWHRGYDDGLWLDEGDGDVELIRRLQAHAWIIDQFDSLESDPVEEPKRRELDFEGILQWNNEVERFRQLGHHVSL